MTPGGNISFVVVGATTGGNIISVAFNATVGGNIIWLLLTPVFRCQYPWPHF